MTKLSPSDLTRLNNQRILERIRNLPKYPQTLEVILPSSTLISDELRPYICLSKRMGYRNLFLVIDNNSSSGELYSSQEEASMKLSKLNNGEIYEINLKGQQSQNQA